MKVNFQVIVASLCASLFIGTSLATVSKATVKITPRSDKTYCSVTLVSTHDHFYAYYAGGGKIPTNDCLTNPSEFQVRANSGNGSLSFGRYSFNHTLCVDGARGQTMLQFNHTGGDQINYTLTGKLNKSGVLKANETLVLKAEDLCDPSNLD